MPAAIADDRAAQDLADFLGDLGLGELDLLADQRGGAFGDVEDELGDRALVAAPGAGSGRIGHRLTATPADPRRRRRRQTIAASRAAAMLASALLAASRPLQTSRLTISLSIARDLTYRGSRPSQIVAMTRVFAWSKSASEAGISSKIQPESSCSIAP